LYANLDIAPTQEKPLAIFMSGSPGAGKTEFAESLVEVYANNDAKLACIDPDKIRMSLPGYEGGKAYVLQAAMSKAVDELYSSLLKNKQSFILDGTFSNFGRAQQNIDRALKRGYEIVIVYVYQDPISAWRFTQAREKEEGRKIELDIFVQQYFSAKETVNKLKVLYGKHIRVALVAKDIFQGVRKFETNIDNIDSYIKFSYSETTLKEALES